MIADRLEPRRAGAVLILAFALASCGPTSSGPSSGAPGTGPSAPVDAAGPSAPPSGSVAGLVAAARQEGTLTTIGLLPDRCNYAEAIATFESKYRIKVDQLAPAADSADQLAAIRAGKDHPDAPAPDAIDIAAAAADQARTDGLLDPYQVATWGDIPTAAKDPDGFWYGGYYAVIAFESNTAAVPTPPQDWADLLRASHRRQVALAGDPRVDTQATQSVFAASLSQPGGSLDRAQPGLAFFRKLADAGNLLRTVATSATVGDGSTPIAIRWSNLAVADQATGSPAIDVAIPEHGRLAGYNVQAISASARHPNAARLWMEFLFSDEGQIIWLGGGCNPIRFTAMQQADAIPAELLARVPDSSGAVFPTPAQLDAATKVIHDGWDSVVGVDIK